MQHLEGINFLLFPLNLVGRLSSIESSLADHLVALVRAFFVFFSYSSSRFQWSGNRDGKFILRLSPEFPLHEKGWRGRSKSLARPAHRGRRRNPRTDFFPN